MIASVTRPFCGDCDRVRLTADGQVRNCLFAREESDLRAALRGGRDRRGARRSAGGAAVAAKLPGHGIDDPYVPPADATDVGHRRLSARPAPSGSERGRLVLCRNPRAPRKAAQRVPVLVARQPLLAPLGRVQLRVVPEQRPRASA